MLKTIPITQIVCEDRVRQDLGDIQELAASIRQHGLIQPLAVEALEDGRYRVVAGGRRFEACKLAGLTEIPCRIYDYLTEEEYKVIELEENLQRKSLTWQEEVLAKKQIHDLRMKMHGAKKHPLDTEGWSMTLTAEEIGETKANLSYDLELARAMEEFPDLDWNSCQTKSEARRKLKQFEDHIIRQELAKRAESEIPQLQTGDRVLEKKILDSYILADCLEAMKGLPDETFDFCEVDPPYGIDLMELKKTCDYSSTSKYARGSYNEVRSDIYPDFLHQALELCYKKLRNDSFLILWFAPEPWFETCFNVLRDVGFKVNRICGIWVKEGSTGQTRNPTYVLGNAYEMFFIARKGAPKLQRPGRSNVWYYKPVPSQQKFHPTQRPYHLMRDILETFSMKGANVLVPFAGSGITLATAWLNDRKALGYDLDQTYKGGFISLVQQLLKEVNNEGS